MEVIIVSVTESKKEADKMSNGYSQDISQLFDRASHAKDVG